MVVGKTQIELGQSALHKNGSILIVDDMPENLFALKELLSEQCDQITCANSGNEALSLLLKENHYSLILLDVQMPGLDGFGTLSLMKKHPKTCDIPVIFITAIHNDEKYLYEGFETGAVDYICKPIDPVLMRSKVSVFMELQNNKHKLEVELHHALIEEQNKGSILDYSAEGIISIDEFGYIVFSNPASNLMLGYQEKELDNQHIYKIVAPHLQNRDSWNGSPYAKAIEKFTQIKEKNIHFYKKDGANIKVDLSVGGYDGKTSRGGVLVFQDITERKKEEEALLYLATHDSLTQLPNKLMFSETLNNTVTRANRYEYELYVMFIDLDHFKNINDELGHNAGDSLLKDVAKRLKSVGRSVDVFARIGGDEFAVIFEDDNGSFNAEMVTSKILTALKKPFYFNNQEMYITASIGVVKYPDYGSNADELLNAADVAMYRAKQLGRNQVQYFDALSHKEAVNRTELKFDLKQGLINKEIKCYYQPILNSNGGLISLEVLARWEHPLMGVLEPHRFIGIAEETGVIANLSYQLFVSAFENLQKWEAAGLVSERLKLSFNLSHKQLFRKSIIDDVLRLNSDYGIDLKRIILEVNEIKLTEDTENLVSTVNELKLLGINITIDCFGSGYSSLRLISKLKTDILKIDKSLVNSNDSIDKKIIESILVFANKMDITVVAVGIEANKKKIELEEMGVKYFQGYLLGKPVDEKEIEYDLLNKYQANH